jgi:hypothetical protein
MAWKQPETFGVLPPIAWPVEMGVYVLAMSAEDWVKVLSALGGTGLLTAFGAWWERSSTRKLSEARGVISERDARIAGLEDDIKAIKASRQEERDRCRGEADEMRKEIDSLQSLNSEKDKIISEQNAQIHSRDLLVLDNTRNITRLSRDIADLSDAFLILKGDARPRER